ncbi:MAG: MarR family transcriptional regulator [Acidimicrobiia bacterium]|nr:MarR family transcriptional regulator [Acidimicrobiia bacterium]
MSRRNDQRVRIGLLFQIFRTHELTAKLVTRALETTGLRGDDYAVYSYLLHGPMTLTQLADGTGMPLTTAAGYVKRFEEKGHLVRRPNPDDGRSQLLELTGSARSWILDVAKVFTATVSRLDGIMESEGIDVGQLMATLELVQEVIELTVEEVDAET